MYLKHTEKQAANGCFSKTCRKMIDRYIQQVASLNMKNSLPIEHKHKMHKHKHAL